MWVVGHAHIGKVLVREHLEDAGRRHGRTSLTIVSVPELAHLPVVFLQVGGEVGEEHADEVARHISVHACTSLTLVEICHIDTQRTHKGIIGLHPGIGVECHRDVKWHFESILPCRIGDGTTRKVVDGSRTCVDVIVVVVVAKWFSMNSIWKAIPLCAILGSFCPTW